MSRIIDADSLFKTIEQNDYYVMSPENNVDRGMFTTGIKQAIDEQPTVDAVEVVRCKDCVNHGKCTAEDTFLFSGIADGFCRVGKRKVSE